MTRRPLLTFLALPLVCALAGAAARAAAPADGVPSDLWGRHGEKWSPQGRLPDFSYAGYHRGEDPLPTVKAGVSVKRFGAVGDGRTDDTAAFKKAIAEAPAGAIEIPPGRYLLTDILEIKRPNLVLRGAGPGKTTLYFPKFLNDIKPNMGATTSGRPTSNYSWSGGFVWVSGSFQGQELTTVAAPAKRGENTIAVASAARLKVGQTVDVSQRDVDDDSLAVHLYAGQSGPTAKLLSRTSASLTARVVRVDGNRVKLDRALPFDVEARWQPRVLRFDPSVREVGIESVRFEFPVLPYGGHFTELGHNPIAFAGVADCWARDIVIDHADSGIFMAGRYCTVTDVTYNSARGVDKSLQCTGHHGVYISGDDNLFTRFRFNTRFVHDISVSHCRGNVISAGSGADLCFDHHKRVPYANLFSDIDLGAGTRMYRCGGGADLGKHSAAHETFWNIRAAKPQAWPPAAFGPDLMNLVGVQSDRPADKSPAGKWFEPIPPKQLWPQDLHQAQLQRRMRK